MAATTIQKLDHLTNGQASVDHYKQNIFSWLLLTFKMG
jgi:hypothetical protein